VSSLFAVHAKEEEEEEEKKKKKKNCFVPVSVN
jgi:hypothetical protein